MNNIKNCMAERSIVSGLPEESKTTLLSEHRKLRRERRLDQVDVLCGNHDAETKKLLLQAVLAMADRNKLLVTV